MGGPGGGGAARRKAIETKIAAILTADQKATLKALGGKTIRLAQPDDRGGHRGPGGGGDMGGPASRRPRPTLISQRESGAFPGPVLLGGRPALLLRVGLIGHTGDGAPAELEDGVRVPPGQGLRIGDDPLEIGHQPGQDGVALLPVLGVVDGA